MELGHWSGETRTIRMRTYRSQFLYYKSHMHLRWIVPRSPRWVVRV